jgi:high-affinity iron transporter
MAAERRRPARAAVLALVAGVLLAGCGNGGTTSVSTATGPRAQPITQQNPVSLIQRATPAEYRAPIAQYRRYVAGRLAIVDRHVTALRRAITAGDRARAREQWRDANAAYQSVGAAYGAFGDLDAAVNASPAGLPRGVHDHGFTGLHRVELALWGAGTLRAAAAPAGHLQAAVRRMRRALPTVDIDPLEYSLRAHEILEDTLDLQLTGLASPWSGAVYDGVAANVAGVREVLHTLRPMIDARARNRRLEADRSLATLSTAVDGLRLRDGRLPTASATTPATHRRIAALVAGAAETLSYVPEVIDPRPPRPVRSPYAEAP